MTWRRPTELLQLAGILALVIAWPRLHAPTLSQRLFAEVFAIGVGTNSVGSGLLAPLLAGRAMLVNSHERPALPRDLAGAVAWAGVDSTLTGGQLQHALRRTIATRCGYRDGPDDHVGWVVMLLSPEEQAFYGKTLEKAMARLVWLMALEPGVGSFLVG